MPAKAGDSNASFLPAWSLSVASKRLACNGYDVSSRLLVQSIRDVREDLSAPKMPFVIGVMGIGGVKTKQPSALIFRKAQAAPASLPEFGATW